MDLSFSKNDHFSPPLDSLRSWVLSARSEVLAYYTVEAVPSTQWRKSILSSDLHLCASNGVFWSPFGLIHVGVPFSLKTNLISLNSLCSWVLSAHSEVLAYYTIEAVPSTQWRKSIGFRFAYMASNGGLCLAFWFFSEKINASLLLSIPYVVGFSVRTQRCLLIILSKGFLPHSRENFLSYELHIWPPMAVFVQPCNFFTKKYNFSPPLNFLRSLVLIVCSEVLAYSWTS